MPNELLNDILVPHGSTKNATYEVRQKEALDWPLERLFLADFIGSVLGRAMRNENLGEKLIRHQRRFARRVVSRRDEKLVGRHLASPRSGDQLDLRAQSNESRPQARRADKVSRTAVPQNGVILVLTIGNQRFA